MFKWTTSILLHTVQFIYVKDLHYTAKQILSVVGSATLLSHDLYYMHSAENSHTAETTQTVY